MPRVVAGRGANRIAVLSDEANALPDTRDTSCPPFFAKPFVAKVVAQSASMKARRLIVALP